MSISPPALDGRRQRRQLLGLLALVVFVVAQLLGYQIFLSYHEDIDGAKTTTRNYATIFETRLDATLRRTDTVLQALLRTTPEVALDKLAVAGFAGAMNAELDSRLLNFDELAGLRIFDAAGELLYTSNRAATTSSNVADRRYFAQLRDNPRAGLIFPRCSPRAPRDARASSRRAPCATVRAFFSASSRR